MAPTWSTSRMPSSTRLTDSVKVIWTSVGGLVSCAPFAGVMFTSSACAAAGDAKNSANKTASVAERATRRAAVLSGAIKVLLAHGGGCREQPGSFPASQSRVRR